MCGGQQQGGPGRELCPVSRAEGSRVVAGTGRHVLYALCLCCVPNLLSSPRGGSAVG